MTFSSVYVQIIHAAAILYRMNMGRTTLIRVCLVFQTVFPTHGSVRFEHFDQSCLFRGNIRKRHLNQAAQRNKTHLCTFTDTKLNHFLTFLLLQCVFYERLEIEKHRGLQVTTNHN